MDTTVNGPKDVAEWDDIAWRHHEDNVVRLRQRIFKARREMDRPMVRSLQKSLLRSWSNTLISVRKTTQRHAGRRTAGAVGWASGVALGWAQRPAAPTIRRAKRA